MKFETWVNILQPLLTYVALCHELNGFRESPTDSTISQATMQC